MLHAVYRSAGAFTLLLKIKSILLEDHSGNPCLLPSAHSSHTASVCRAQYPYQNVLSPGMPMSCRGGTACSTRRTGGKRAGTTLSY
jgi:hypothetical protein